MNQKDIESRVSDLLKNKYRFVLLEDEDEGGYVISFPDLPGCLSVGATIEEAIKNGDDAKKEWFYACLEEGVDVPEPFSAEDYSGQLRLRMPKSLHKHLAERAKEEGISMNQYCVYILSHAG